MPGPAAILLAACVAVQPPPLTPGVSLDLARDRAATLANVRYQLDLDVRAADHATGIVTISFERSADARDRAATPANVRYQLDLDVRAADHANGTPVTDARWERDHIIVPAAHLTRGTNTVRLSFTAPIAAAGAAIISYDDAPDNARYLQMRPRSSAPSRRVIPHRKRRA